MYDYIVYNWYTFIISFCGWQHLQMQQILAKIQDKVSHLVEIVIVTKRNSLYWLDKIEVGVCRETRKLSWLDEMVVSSWRGVLRWLKWCWWQKYATIILNIKLLCPVNRWIVFFIYGLKSSKKIWTLNNTCTT